MKSLRTLRESELMPRMETLASSEPTAHRRAAESAKTTPRIVLMVGDGAPGLIRVTIEKDDLDHFSMIIAFPRSLK